MPSKHDEVGTTRVSRNSTRVDYWCCPFGAHCVAAARFGRHVATCRAEDSALFRAAFAPCRRCATHLVAHADAATHAARCGTPCPAAAREPHASVRCLPCRCCGAAVRVDACRCAWCRLHQPFVLADPADIALLRPEYARVRSGGGDDDGDGSSNEGRADKQEKPPQQKQPPPQKRARKEQNSDKEEEQWGQWK